MKNIERAAEFVLLMDKQLKNQLFVVNGEVQGKKLWENTFIKHQLDKRDAGDMIQKNFSVVIQKKFQIKFYLINSVLRTPKNK